MPRPHFDHLAAPYVWLERLSYGGLLQWCRTALLGELSDARFALVLGDGDGRFLEAFVKANTEVRIDAFDVSPAMVALAERRVCRATADRVHFTVADVRDVCFSPGRYDLIVTNFFLDCFAEAELRTLIAELIPALKPGGRWLVGDFRRPDSRVPRLIAAVALAGMYLFFRVATRISASRLVDPASVLDGHGLRVQKRVSRFGGFLTAELWQLPSDSDEK
ncbi:class I SAM-dependent methyltransferase [Limnoglobus roseus]|uniref:Class I SAM-dependent methyltransferase n=1 Tax=Limnoglobus roseus TaxID=2598579 RepID=A0A5C1APS8_9BACT|nr:class I SAM-dependent methyltransferase [Limnoglobus roseus]QEL20167.1 class I SAM-dependent methyltransferase [Limnoglobus roseus]